ncbi:histidine phosphotransferase family protein [Magnetospirillum sp. SS-4]|uniref:histidine phosphotransferase family protein n=1 Tax=Magnetospirillum sp. SS-4 TaxID=2681465 RepID=UPI0013838E82|nr:histidine phosphotransferase family protein [Magnetospirillum sp. SS-4]CAA7615832.1 conserved hypothetical protein [Magnetospirillum sp. SS-4]
MTPLDDMILAEMLCARLCHDMAGAVGATAAGAELLEDGLDAETARMVADSAAAAVARLKFFRAALGPSGPGQPAGTVRDLISAYLKASAPGARTGHALRWQCERSSLDGDLGRLLLNLVLLARDCLPRGGAISVTVSALPPPESAGLSVTFEGEGAGLGTEIAPSLIEGRRPEGPRGAQAWLTRRLAEAMSARLRYHPAIGGGRIDA